jgi:hypothetical protein
VRRVAVVVIASVVAALAGASAGAVSARALDPFTGLGAWVSIYDGAAAASPEATVETLAANGVHTLFLETANYKQRVDVVRPAIVARFLAAAHAAGIQVVGWYLPSLANPVRDLRRALAGAQFTSAGGDEFDGFALDVEATVVRRIALRNARAAALESAMRRSLGVAYPLGAITIAPVGASPTYWPGYPFAALARNADVLLPLEYFTSRVRGAARVAAYTQANISTIRSLVGDPTFPVDAIGGSSPKATGAEVTAFVDTAASCGTVGASLWEFAAMTPAEWAALAPASELADAAGDC